MERSAWSLETGLWTVAFATLAIDALLGRTNEEGIASLAGLGHLLWGIALVRERRDEGAEEQARGRRLSALILAVPTLVEALGFALASTLGHPDQQVWYLLALGFGVAGALTALRDPPADSVLASQMYFHLMMSLPIIPTLIAAALAASDAGASRGVLVDHTNLAAQFRVVAVLIPLDFVAVGATLALHLLRSSRRRGLAWSALLAHQACFLVLVFRWANSRI